MKVGKGPSQKGPLGGALFTRTFTPNGLSRGASQPPVALGGAVSGPFPPVKAGKEVPEHRSTLRGHLGIVWILQLAGGQVLTLV